MKPADVVLDEAIRVRRIRELPAFFGKGLWQGNLTGMRDDRPAAGKAVIK